MDSLLSSENQKRIWARVSCVGESPPLPPQEKAPALPADMWGTLYLMRRIGGMDACLSALHGDCAAVSARWYLQTGKAPSCEKPACPDTMPALLRLCILRRQNEIARIRASGYLAESHKAKLICRAEEHIRFLTARLERCFR